MTVKYTKQYLENLVKESKSFSEVSFKANGNKRGGACQWVTNKILKYGIDISHFDGGRSNSIIFSRNRSKSPEEILILTDNQTGRHVYLKRALIDTGIEYVCSECGIFPYQNNKELTLHIDHTNGNRFDHRKENLRFLCPNCHSQTSNFGFKNRGMGSKPKSYFEYNKKRMCSGGCGKVILNKNKTGYCRECLKMK